MAQSSDVIRIVNINWSDNASAIPPSGKYENASNKPSSTFSFTISAMLLGPNISKCKAVPPKVVNQTTASRAGTSKTPAINSLIVRPREIRAINNPIKGAQEICQAQKKIVFVPSHSLSEKGVNVKLIGMTFVMYP